MPEQHEVTLKNSGDDCWVHVGPLSVCITRTDEGVVYDIWTANEDGVDSEMLDSGWTAFTDADKDDDWVHPGDPGYHGDKEGD